MITVYADILVGVNILITYLLLVCTRLFCRVPTNKWGIALSSLFGGISSIMIFFDSINNGLWIVLKLATAAIIVGVAFLPRSPRLFSKLFLSFFGVSFLFGGVMYAVEISFDPKNILYVNGTVYFDMSLAYLVGSVLIIYGIFLLCNYFLSRHFAQKEIFRVKITFRKESVEVNGFLDTGNNLKDGITGRPVIIAELFSIAPILTAEERAYFKNENYDKVPESLKTRVRLIPCATVAGDGILKGFVPESVHLCIGKKEALNDEAIVAVSAKPLCSGEYQVILDNSVTELNWRDKVNEKSIV